MTDSKDWTGNKASVYKTLAASNHSNSEREKNDFYATDFQTIGLFENEKRIKTVIFSSGLQIFKLSRRTMLH